MHAPFRGATHVRDSALALFDRSCHVTEVPGADVWGLRGQEFTSCAEPVPIICTLCTIVAGLYATLLWVQLSCGHFALFARVTF